MKWVFVIASADPETIFNALRLANVTVQKGQEVSVFMLGRAVDFETLSTDDFDLAAQTAAFQEEGDFYV